jgi:phenylacetate-coenzyme A ligase PaaK-like adenylate-forming protein
VSGKLASPAAIPRATDPKARLAELVKFARTRSPFYSKLYEQVSADVDHIHDLPPVTKPQLMANFDGWATDPAVTRTGVDAFLADQTLVGHLYLERYTVWRTSGVTGEQGIFLHDSDAHTVYSSLQLVRGILAWAKRGYLQAIQRQGSREAVITATGGHFAITSLMESRRRLHQDDSDCRRIFPVFAPLPELVRELNHFQPTTMFSYPSALMMLAYEQVARRLNIEPAVIGVGGETLTPQMRDQITAAFSCPLLNTYAACEFPAIAFECAYGWLHVNADWVILEPVDRTYQPVPLGQPSHTVLLTNLVNRIQPIIRYDLGDSIIVRPDTCPCGSSLPAIQVEGRHEEILRFVAPNGEVIQVMPRPLRTPVKMTPGVRRHQLIQTAPTTLSVRLAIEPTADERGVWEAVIQYLQNYLSAQGLPNIEILRTPELPKRDPVSGKYRRVWAEKGAEDIYPAGNDDRGTQIREAGNG